MLNSNQNQNHQNRIFTENVKLGLERANSRMHHMIEDWRTDKVITFSCSECSMELVIDNVTISGDASVFVCRSSENMIEDERVENERWGRNVSGLRMNGYYERKMR